MVAKGGTGIPEDIPEYTRRFSVNMPSLSPLCTIVYTHAHSSPLHIATISLEVAQWFINRFK